MAPDTGDPGGEAGAKEGDTGEAGWQHGSPWDCVDSTGTGGWEGEEEDALRLVRATGRDEGLQDGHWEGQGARAVANGEDVTKQTRDRQCGQQGRVHSLKVLTVCVCGGGAHPEGDQARGQL